MIFNVKCATCFGLVYKYARNLLHTARCVVSGILFICVAHPGSWVNAACSVDTHLLADCLNHFLVSRSFICLQRNQFWFCIACVRIFIAAHICLDLNHVERYARDHNMPPAMSLRMRKAKQNQCFFTSLFEEALRTVELEQGIWSESCR